MVARDERIGLFGDHLPFAIQGQDMPEVVQQDQLFVGRGHPVIDDLATPTYDCHAIVELPLPFAYAGRGRNPLWMKYEK